MTLWEIVGYTAWGFWSTMCGIALVFALSDDGDDV